MSTKNPGCDDGPDYEQIARRDKALELERVFREEVHPNIEKVAETTRNGTQAEQREAYRTLAARVVEFLEISEMHLQDLGAVDRQDPDHFALIRAIETAGCLADGRSEQARSFLDDTHGAINDLDGDSE